jgi:hypothetical protein
MSSVTAVPLRPVKRTYLIYLWIGVVLACVGAFALARQGDDVLARNARARGVTVTASGLQYQVLKAAPAGAARPTDADIALVNYEGKLLNGKTFDKSQQPTPFPVAPGATVPGFSEAMKLVPKGGRYRFWLKPELAYGAEAKGDAIPANSTLVFDIEMLDFKSEAEVRQMQMQMQQQQMMGGAMPGAAPGGVPR